MEYPKPRIKHNRIRKTSFKVASVSHRLDGPAWNHHKHTIVWHRNNSKHRLDGLAVVWTDIGGGYCSIHDINITDSNQEFIFHEETLKLGSITQFIDFIARCDIIML